MHVKQSKADAMLEAYFAAGGQVERLPPGVNGDFQRYLERSAKRAVANRAQALVKDQGQVAARVESDNRGLVEPGRARRAARKARSAAR